MPLAGQGEEHLGRKEAASIVVLIQHPYGNPFVATGFDLARLRVVVIESIDGHPDLPPVPSIGDPFKFHVGLTNEPEALVANALFLEVFS